MHSVLGLYLRIVLNRGHVDGAARVVERNAARAHIGPVPKRGARSGYTNVIGAAQIGMRVIVRIVIVAQAVDVCPSLQRPIDRVADTCAPTVVNARFVDALLEPVDSGVLQCEEILYQVIGSQALMDRLLFEDQAFKSEIGAPMTRQSPLQKQNRPEESKSVFVLGLHEQTILQPST